VSADPPRRRRRLSDDERRLWSSVARSVLPLAGMRQIDETAPANPVSTPRPAHVAPPSPASPPRLAPIDLRARRRLARGRDAIDRRIDLHGMTQAQAHAALARFLRQAQADEARYVLVVTGKGRGPELGVLRRQVPLWLGLPEFRNLVVGFDLAHIGHGGEGALYVQVRRRR
jgi:DNA-nicking Smr family endonuclease